MHVAWEGCKGSAITQRIKTTRFNVCDGSRRRVGFGAGESEI